MKPRVGHIQFINCFPLFYGLIEKKFLLDIDLIKGNPTDLNRMLYKNLLDLAPIPSIAYARNYQDYVLMPDISVSADGNVKSIYLFSKVPIDQLDRRKVALTNISATSVALLRIIMARGYNIVPDYFTSAPELGAMLLEADAALLIGDDALRAKYQHDNQLYVYDLGQEWKNMTGKPMVFAVWAIREDYAEKHRQDIITIRDTFTDSIRLSLEQVETVAAKAAEWEDFPPEYLVDYFRTLRFDFDYSKQEGLMEYYREAYNLGIIDSVPPLKIMDI